MNFSSIRFKLIIGGILVVLGPLTVCGYVATSNSARVATELSKANVQSIARGAATEVAATYEGEKKFAGAFANRTQVKIAAEAVAANGIEGATEAVAVINADMKKRFEKLSNFYSAIFLTDAEGVLYASAAQSGEDIAGLGMAWNSLFEEARATKEAVSGPITRSKSSAELIMMFCAPVHANNGTFLGVFGALFKVRALTDLIAAKEIGATGYCFMVDSEGIIIAHPVEKYVLQLDFKSIRDAEMLTKGLLSGQTGAESYTFEGVNKVAGFAPFPQKGWSVAATQNTDEFLASVVSLRNTIALISIISLLLTIVVVFLAAGSITRPINKAVAGLKDIAQGEGDLTMRLALSSRDEIGELAKWFNVFIEKLQKIIAQISENTQSVNVSSGELSGVAADLAKNAEETSNRADNVATAAEEMSVNLNSVAAAMEQSTTNTTMVAGAAEEMTTTISLIAQNAEQAHTISAKAVQQAASTSNRMSELGKAAQAISKVTETITEISEQTNLLALNATIEAARAGEAGKGFAVVANEIKELAKQTATATMDIKVQIEGVQGTTRATVDEIGQISVIIGEINGLIVQMATAVGEQSATTGEIAANISQASLGLSEVSENASQSSLAAGSITQDIVGVNRAAGEITRSSRQVKSSADRLLELATDLQRVVNTFKF
jgi:methyl-accepting chemotaxis protein